MPLTTTSNHSTLCEEKTMSRYFRNFVAGSLALFSLGSQAQQNFDNVEIEVLPVRDGIYMLVGAGGNITVQTGVDGVLMIDTQYAELSEKIYSKIQELSPAPIR